MLKDVCVDDEDTDPDTDVCNVTALDLDLGLAKKRCISSASHYFIYVLPHTLSNDCVQFLFNRDVPGEANDYRSAIGVNTPTILCIQAPWGNTETHIYSRIVLRRAVAAVHGDIQPTALCPTIQQHAPPSVIASLQPISLTRLRLRLTRICSQMILLCQIKQLPVDRSHNLPRGPDMIIIMAS